jgi:transcriptional repressor NrdR
MRCPFCHTEDTKVVDSRLVGDGDEVRRRRECIQCKERFTTYEIVEISLPRLIKKDGSFVQFREEKLRAGILRALEKRSVSMQEVDALVNRIIAKLRALGEKEVSTKTLGDIVMTELKEIDVVAYVRFASVYRCFDNVEAFLKEIAELKQNA